MLIFPCSQSSRKKSAHKKVLLNLPWLLLAYCTMRRCWKRMAKSWATQLAADDEMMMPRIDPFNNRFTKWSIDARNRSEVRKYIRTCWKINSLVLWWHYWKHHLHPPAPFENHPKKQLKTHENTEGGTWCLWSIEMWYIAKDRHRGVTEWHLENVRTMKYEIPGGSPNMWNRRTHHPALFRSSDVGE